MEGTTNLEIIQNKIFELREYKVMLDFDLAEIYGIENKYLKRAVRHNIERFEGEDFMFKITKEELSRCKNCTLNSVKKGRGSNIKYLPYAFTELGVAMLSSVLNSKPAMQPLLRQILNRIKHRKEPDYQHGNQDKQQIG